MLPGVYEFRWDLGHAVFLGAFFAVGIAIALTLAWVALRVRRLALTPAPDDQGRAHLEAARWHAEFEELPDCRRRCRHEVSGELPSRLCTRGFDCRGCGTHAAIQKTRPGPKNGERLYHRGHAFAQSDADGTVRVGVDEVARALIGSVDDVMLPRPGTRLSANGTAFTLRMGEDKVRVLSPIDGEVIEIGDWARPFLLRLRPTASAASAPEATMHLLHGEEAARWCAFEREALHTRETAFPPDEAARLWRELFLTEC